MENRFFTFIAPYLAAIDDGRFFRKPFSWLYSLIAIINLLLPFYLLYQAIDNRIFSAGSKIVFGFILAWLTIGIACWIGFQLWWDRKNKISLSSSTGDEFIATPTFSHFIQTLGEWIGTLIGLIGFVFGILSIIALGDAGYYLSRQLGVGFINMGILSIIFAPVYGFLIIILTRFLAEQIRALVAIANNTKKQ
ncbi:hypothetical protein JW948_08395 [bacterium]|nr:hypothetical protein [bacterium]